MIFRICLVLALLLQIQVDAQTEYSASLRTYPFGAAIEGKISRDLLIWDSRIDSGQRMNAWKFGAVGVRLTVATHGKFDATLALYPISFLQLSAGVGGTSRFYRPNTFDCDRVICSGFLQRSHLGAKLALALGEAQQWVLVPSYDEFYVQHENTSQGQSQRVGDETELILANPSGDTGVAKAYLLGYRFQDWVIGFYQRDFHYNRSDQSNRAEAGLIQKRWSDSSLGFGLGFYSSDFYMKAGMVLLQYETHFGESLSFF